MGSLDRRVDDLQRKTDAAAKAAWHKGKRLPYILRDNGDGIPRDYDGNPVDLSDYPADGPKVFILHRITEDTAAAERYRQIEKRRVVAGREDEGM
jgi:hypothetical protein